MKYAKIEHTQQYLKTLEGSWLRIDEITSFHIDSRVKEVYSIVPIHDNSIFTVQNYYDEETSQMSLDALILSIDYSKS